MKETGRPRLDIPLDTPSRMLGDYRVSILAHETGVHRNTIYRRLQKDSEFANRFYQPRNSEKQFSYEAETKRVLRLNAMLMRLSRVSNELSLAQIDQILDVIK